MRRLFALSLLLTLAVTADVGAQVVDETLVPRGRLRLLFEPSFSYWNSRYGDAGEEDLGSDLTDPTGASVFPGVATLAEQIEALTGSGYSPVLGASSAVVNYDVTRIDLGAHVGVFDWLTVGVVVPIVRNRTWLQTAFRPDTLDPQLGVNPAIQNSDPVASFLSTVENAALGAGAQADAACASDPSSAACSSAVDLATRATDFFNAAQAAYLASSVFPMAGSEAAGELADAAAELSADLASAGLGGILGFVFATDPLSTGSLNSLPTTPGSGAQGALPLGSIDGAWELGDVEVSVLMRLLEGEVRDSGDAEPRLSYTVGGGVLTRLGTGKRDRTDVFLDLPSGDGQMDIEGRVFGFVGFGSRLGVRGAARYGVQRSTTLLRRVAPPEVVMPGVGTLRAVKWSPASYVGLEIEPMIRLTESLSLMGSFRTYTKGADDYEVLGEMLMGQSPVDVTDLERESEVSRTHLGVGVRYTTVSQWMRGEAGSPMELHVRVLYPLSGSGGQVPVETRAELGVRLFRGIWGGARSPAN